MQDFTLTQFIMSARNQTDCNRRLSDNRLDGSVIPDDDLYTDLSV